MSQSGTMCSKCGHEMIQGHQLRALWIPGLPTAPPFVKALRWTGLILAGTTIPVATFRCSSCGFLEFYAREEFAAK